MFSSWFANGQFWEFVVIPALAGIMTFVVTRRWSTAAAMTCLALIVGTRSIYWLVVSVPGLTKIGVPAWRAIGFVIGMTVLPASIASTAGWWIGARRPRIGIVLGVVLVLLVAIAGSAGGWMLALSLVELVNASG